MAEPLRASAARRISAAPIPRPRARASTASGPSSRAGRAGPALTCHSRDGADDAARFRPRRTTARRPAKRPSRRRSAALCKRAGTEGAVEQASRAGMSVERSLRIVTMANSFPPRVASIP